MYFMGCYSDILRKEYCHKIINPYYDWKSKLYFIFLVFEIPKFDSGIHSAYNLERIQCYWALDLHDTDFLKINEFNLERLCQVSLCCLKNHYQSSFLVIVLLNILSVECLTR